MSTLSRSLIRQRALGAYLGLALGDALGATVEFMTPSEIQQAYGLHRNIRGGGWLKLKAGQVTDDTTMALALGQAILATPEWDSRVVAEHFAGWLKAKPVDCGNACRRGIQRFLTTGQVSGPVGEDAGNGAAMRNLPVALATLGDPKLMSEWTLAQAHITHNNGLSDAACLTLGHMVQGLLQGGGVKACRSEANRLVAQHPVFRFTPYPRRASGYIVDTMQTVLHYYFRNDSVQSCLIQTVNQGDDADTTGALIGMLAGATYGLHDLPAHWLKQLDPDIKRSIVSQTEALLLRSPLYRSLPAEDYSHEPHYLL